MRLDAFFDRTLIINLPARADRRRETVAELERYGVAVGGGNNDDRVAFFDATKPADAGGFPTLGSHGCFLSHLAALRHARDGGARRLLVLEDDARPMPALRSVGPEMLADLDRRPWEMAMLGWQRKSDLSLPTADRPRWKPTDEQYIGTHAYAVQGDGFDKLIALMAHTLAANEPRHPDGRRWHIDELYWIYGRDGHIRQLMALPTLFGQRSSRSDVVGELSWKETTPVVRTLYGLARRVVNATRA